jgi:hypothetical protein
MPPALPGETQADYMRRLETKEGFSETLGLKEDQPPPKGTIPAGGSPAGPVQIANDEEYADLPSGTVFVGPDGVTRTKP